MRTPRSRPSLRAAINGFCRSCLYDARSAGRWREQISACTATHCPLWPVRPTTTSTADDPETVTFEAETDAIESEADPSAA